MSNTNPLTYNGYVQQIATLAVVNTTTSGSIVVGVDSAFNAIIPQMLNYAELRIQKDLDLLPAKTSNSNYVITNRSNTVAVSPDDFQIIDTVSCVVNTSTIPLIPVSKEFIQSTFNDSSFLGTPTYFAMYGGDAGTGGLTSNIILIGPYANSNYNLVLTGSQWLPTLYTQVGLGANTTYISTNYPDLLIQASMVYISQFQRNFGPASNDPQMPGGYEAQYQTLLKSALEIENRKKFRDAAWSSQSQSPVATPSR